MFKLIWFLIKIIFHLSTLFIPLILWLILKAIFTTSYEDKLKNISGIGDNSVKLILEKYPNEEELRIASVEEISNNILGIGTGTAKKIKETFY